MKQRLEGVVPKEWSDPGLRLGEDLVHQGATEWA
jgi:hypothetical protein